jgi:DeoR/GlpR family transcriptional regulator of sugar metabolism
MKTKKRQKKIVTLLKQRNYISVGELTEIFDVSEMTIWRDLKTLANANLIIRTYGGAIPAHAQDLPPDDHSPDPAVFHSCDSDVLILTSANPGQNFFFLENEANRTIPLIAESTPHPNAIAHIGINDYRAGYDLGCWVGHYAVQHWLGTANILIWSYNLPNTEARSRGFLSGLNETLPEIGEVISLNPTNRDDLAYQLTRDALEVNPNINVIFALNDNNAWGAVQACIDLEIDPQQTIVIPFGLEGDTMKNALQNNLYCPIGLAMFPEIVGRICIDAAIAAYNQVEFADRVETPYLLMNRESLPNFYKPSSSGWYFLWESAQEQLGLPLTTFEPAIQKNTRKPNCVGIYLTFPKHEWYQNMVASMQEYAEWLDIKVEILDADLDLKNELEFAKRWIAKRAADEIAPGDTIFISSGVVTQYLSEYIQPEKDITVITNSTAIFKNLADKPKITLMSTGGILRRDSSLLVGPSAENAIQELRVDKLFLTVSGVSLEFGLSHANISEITIKQAMIKSARQVILLADHTKFNQESFIQIAPIEVVDKLITDSNLPAHVRLQLNAAGIEVIVARSENLVGSLFGKSVVTPDRPSN